MRILKSGFIKSIVLIKKVGLIPSKYKRNKKVKLLNDKQRLLTEKTKLTFTIEKTMKNILMDEEKLKCNPIECEKLKRVTTKAYSRSLETLSLLEEEKKLLQEEINALINQIDTL